MCIDLLKFHAGWVEPKIQTAKSFASMLRPFVSLDESVIAEVCKAIIESSESIRRPFVDREVTGCLFDLFTHYRMFERCVRTSNLLDPNSHDFLHLESRMMGLEVFVSRQLQVVSSEACFTRLVASLVEYPPRSIELYVWITPYLQEIRSSATEDDQEDLMKTLELLRC
jgi:hypothetical protein